MYWTCEKHQKDNGEHDKRQSDVDEAVLLKDWDFARFFPSRSADAKVDAKEKMKPTKEAEQKRAQLQRQSRIEMEDAWAKYKAIATPPSRHKQLFQKPSEKTTQEKLSDILKFKKEQDSGLNSPNRFFRGFRRENSDLFPLPSTRHSAIYFPKHENPAGASKQMRSSGIFRKHQPAASDEPILTDFIKINDSLKMSAQGEVKKTDKKVGDKRAPLSNPIDALKNVAALIRQDSEKSNGPSRQSSVNSDSPATSICFTSSASFEKAGTPDITANTLENKNPSNNESEPNCMMKPRREKTESDIVFRRNSHYNRHTELMASNGQEAVLAQDQVNAAQDSLLTCFTYSLVWVGT